MSDPTEDMLRAGERELMRQYEESSWETAKDMAEVAQVAPIYQAMAAKAPRPIETAPSSGRFLVYGGTCTSSECGSWPHEGWSIVEVEGFDGGRRAVVNTCYYGVYIEGATHWMPEPPAPSPGT